MVGPIFVIGGHGREGVVEAGDAQGGEESAGHRLQRARQLAGLPPGDLPPDEAGALVDERGSPSSGLCSSQSRPRWMAPENSIPVASLAAIRAIGAIAS